MPKMDAAMRDFTSKRKQDDLPEEQVRKHQVKVMLNDKEVGLLDHARGNLSRSEVLRFLLLNKMPHPIPELNAQAWSELSRASSNLNQLLRYLNSDGMPDVEQIRVTLEQFRASLIGASR